MSCEAPRCSHECSSSLRGTAQIEHGWAQRTEPGSCLWLLTTDFWECPLTSCLNLRNFNVFLGIVTAPAPNQLTSSSKKKMSNTGADWFRRVDLFWMRQSTLGPMRHVDRCLSFYPLCNVLKAEVTGCQVQDFPKLWRASVLEEAWSKATPGLTCFINPDACMERDGYA